MSIIWRNNIAIGADGEIIDIGDLGRNKEKIEARADASIVEKYLTENERKIIRLISAGYKYREIAKMLHKSISTVKVTVYYIRHHKKQIRRLKG